MSYVYFIWLVRCPEVIADIFSLCPNKKSKTTKYKKNPVRILTKFRCLMSHLKGEGNTHRSY